MNAHVFTTIASVSSFNGVRIITNSTNVHVVGSIVRNGLSSLNITWTSPLLENAGLYKCEVNEINELGKPITYDDTGSVAVNELTIDAVFSEIIKLKNRLEQINLNCVTSHEIEITEINRLKQNISVLVNQTSLLKDICETELVHVQDLESQNKLQLTSVENSVQSLTLKQDEMHGKWNASKNEYFISSERFSDKVYLLSRESVFFYPTFAQSLCALHGGYLVEVNTQAEFDFLKQFIRTYGSHFEHVYTGGTDENHEGVWLYRHSQTPVVPFWAPGEPNNDNKNFDENCEEFHKDLQWSMNDLQCSFPNSTVSGFICEVPV
uniref:C-type lectin domain-containing protein n=1 Tax=Biomphalaria glabrata TaxID=6526 RepID=A0A2C9KHD1_BIOGL